MVETVVIILHFRKEKAEEFERLFEADVVPLWREFKAQGKLLAATLSRVVDDHVKVGTQDYMLQVEVPSRKEHDEFDQDRRFLPFLARAQAMQPEEPLVWLGEPLFRA